MSSTGTQSGPEIPSESIAAPRPTDWQRWREVGLVILIAIAPSILTASLALFHPISGIQPSPNFRFAGALLHQVTSIFLVIYVLGRRKLTLKSLGLDFSRWTDLPIALGLAVAGLVLSFIFSTLIRNFSIGVTGHVPDMRDPRVIFAGTSTLLLLIYSGSSAVFEETIVRGYLTTEMVGLACPMWLASIASVLLQTSYHVYYGLSGAMVTSAYFIVFALYFSISKRLLPVILGHLFIDVTAVGLSFLR